MGWKHRLSPTRQRLPLFAAFVYIFLYMQQTYQASFVPRADSLAGKLVPQVRHSRLHGRASVSARRGAGTEQTPAEEGEWSMLNLDFMPRFVVAGTVIPLVVSPVVLVVLEMVIVRGLLSQEVPSSDLTLVNVTGVLVSLLTVFRTQQAYARYWEARSALGRLLAAIVDVASASSAYLQTIGASRDRTATYLRLYAHETTSFLRETSATTKAASEYWRDMDTVAQDVEEALGGQKRCAVLDDLDAKRHYEQLDSVVPRTRPILVLRWTREELYQQAMCHQDGRITHAEAQTLLANSVLPSLIPLQAEYNACAKVASTPFPRAYVQMDRLIRFAYVFSLPIFLCGRVGSEAVPLVALLAFGFYGLDAVANQLQHPFVSAFGDAALDGRFTKAVCDDVDALLLMPQCPGIASPERKVAAK
mmetsp:Transcript_29170/g.67140  ORF Transcript_29170/g.67140 Transcript_29170/m.67140 type:complete len:418 (+) Transcript_29170:95-1348(+)